MTATLRIATPGAELECDVDTPRDATTAPLAILLHGFPDCARSFRHQVAPLLDAGFRVARPTLRGYFPSSLARDGRYDLRALADDVLAIAQELSPHAPVHLIGHDWGAVIAYAIAALSPRLLSSLTTLAVPPLRTALPRWLHPRQLWASRYMLALRRPNAARSILAAHLAPIDALWRTWSPGWELPLEERAPVHAALGSEPHLDAACAYYRAITRVDRALAAALVARIEVPSLYLHGANDGCVVAATANHAAQSYRRGTVKILDDCGHFLHQERPDRVNPPLLQHLERNISSTYPWGRSSHFL